MENRDSNILQVVNFLEKESDCILILTSVNRTVKENKRVGGVKNSHHLKHNGAADFVPAQGCTIEEVAKISCQIVSTIIYKSHIHIDLRRKNKLCLKKY